MKPIDTGTGSGKNQNLYPHLSNSHACNHFFFFVTIILIPVTEGLFSFGPQCATMKKNMPRLKEKVHKEGQNKTWGRGGQSWLVSSLTQD